MKEGKGFYKLNEESIAPVREDLVADYQALDDHQSEEVVQLLEDYGAAELENHTPPSPVRGGEEGYRNR